MSRDENIQAVFDLKAGYTLGLADIEILKRMARMALTAMDGEPDRNPVMAYADSYRDMAEQGVESVPIWSVITDLERNIAPLYRHAQPAPVVPVTDAMAYAFHHALTDSPLGDDDVEDIKAGLRAALVNVFNTQPAPQEVHDEK